MGFRKKDEGKKVCDNVCLYRYERSFHLQGHKTALEKGFGVGFILVLPSQSRSTLNRNVWQPDFPEIAALVR